jgi:S-adenosylmethionine-diacylgycerolhomoserine-N-methlytransferase
LIGKDLKTIWHLLTPNPGKTHQSRLEHFYQKQASHYDQFRQRLLPGRADLFCQLNHHQPHGVWLDVGAGTGSSLDFLSDAQIGKYSQVQLLDLSPTLLKLAQDKIERRQLSNVFCLLADIHELEAQQEFDLITLSYALTMMPVWPLVLEKVSQLLKIGGHIGVVDFYVSAKYPSFELQKHSAWQRHFWPMWFSYDNVHLSPDHLPYLCSHFEVVDLVENTTQLPYIPLSRVPYYWLVGRKQATLKNFQSH